jgi:hypothetical protein
MGKIGPYAWRSLRILKLKVAFPRFMYCFGHFSALTKNLSQSEPTSALHILKKLYLSSFI